MTPYEPDPTRLPHYRRPGVRPRFVVEFRIYDEAGRRMLLTAEDAIVKAWRKVCASIPAEDAPALAKALVVTEFERQRAAGAYRLVFARAGR